MTAWVKASSMLAERSILPTPTVILFVFQWLMQMHWSNLDLYKLCAKKFVAGRWKQSEAYSDTFGLTENEEEGRPRPFKELFMELYCTVLHKEL